jgi:hypothetical protein
MICRLTYCKRLQPAETFHCFESPLSATQQLVDEEAERKQLLSLGPQYNRLNQTPRALDFMEHTSSF